MKSLLAYQSFATTIAKWKHEPQSKHFRDQIILYQCFCDTYQEGVHSERFTSQLPTSI